jgi:riboflavin kinase/FMN adenylyltransferase
MKVLDGLDELPRGLRFVLAIGMFDGVHRGHQKVLRALVSAARQRHAQSVLLTFEPHPATVLRGLLPSILCDEREQRARFAALGIDLLIVQRFDERFAAQPPDEFLRRVGAGRELVAVVMTPDSAFGRDRSGVLPAVRQVGHELGFYIAEVSSVAGEGAMISSTRLRRMIGEGRLTEARRLLGRSYAVIGTVVRGDSRGRDLGYPTANLALDARTALPRDGIYAVRASWGGDDPLLPARSADGVASLGVRPTFGAGERVLEVHLFDTSEDLYGERLRVEFARRLRGEKRFSSAAALVRQMDRDAARARYVLGSRAAGAIRPNAC